ncbi:helix-turn-helix protein [Metamycoplasma subdolum]|uniref:Helix-turn-helix protein n=1 Tax=Metamycoplasma subdolum TaxID=92407 RepID=A0A3M0A1Y8_9BACT|nr:helix-turn-helix transcriptional regulator [Metamycoplasma subdolum]RMA77449.1 helix-turn-helix protein [Metamycoplasma subdolum]WPB50322.1 helix-turn-helix transcriptional regulator [Metamycoplasma subdolum]
MANIIDEKLPDVEKVENRNDTFADKLKFYLEKYEMTQKELALRLGLSVKHINSILNDEVIDVSVSVLEGLEYAFRLETGILTKLYYTYSNLRSVRNNPNIEEQMKSFGLNFIIDHPELAVGFGAKITPDMENHIKLMKLKKFYGVTELPDYRQYLEEHILAETKKYHNKANSYIWIRFCELSVHYDKENLGVFRTGLFEAVLKKVLNMMTSTFDFHKKIQNIKKYLMHKGIILVTKPFIEGSSIRAITLKKGGKRYVFLSDMYHSESYIFFSLLHELIHCFHNNLTEEEIDQKVIDVYRDWEKENPTNYRAIYDAINAYETHRKVVEKDPNIDTSYIWSVLQERYEYVRFEDKELESILKDTEVLK